MQRDQAYFLDILIAARQITQFTTDLKWEHFKTSALHQNAIIRALEVIGEATRKVSQETRDILQDIPWSDMIGMRNRLIHEYFEIDLDKVWDTIINDIPKLIILIEPLVPPED